MSPNSDRKVAGRPDGAPSSNVDVQASGLLADLLRLVDEEAPSLRQLLELVYTRLRDAVGLQFVEVRIVGQYEDAAVPPTTVGEAPGGTVGQLGVPLRFRGTTFGVLTLRGHHLAALGPNVVETIASHIAVTVRALGSDQDRRFAAQSARAVRTLFEEGAAAASVETAGEILARVTAEAFGTERAAVHLVDGDGGIRHVIGFGVPPEVGAALTQSLVGRMAHDSPVWRSTVLAGGPILVDDSNLAPMRDGGFITTMQLRSYVAMPLLSATGLVGMALCGDSTRPRVWSARERELATQLALEGAVVVDGARLRHAERIHIAELTHQAFHDALTGLPNRAFLLNNLQRAIDGAIDKGERLALLLIDLDGFKHVNDTLGHHAGDVLLQRVAERIRLAVRGDMVARLGGDEFAIMVGGNPDRVAIAAVKDRVSLAISAPFTVENDQVQIGASIGVAVLPADACDIGSLMRAADGAMYRSKARRHTRAG